MLAKNDVKRANLKELQDQRARYLIYDSLDNAYYFKNAKKEIVFKHKENYHFLKMGEIYDTFNKYNDEIKKLIDENSKGLFDE
ncbi:hypothetical protein [Campylobacter ureolyticus]|uniref:Uncharacterized protein n=1 Tax=Campylobacter ureolyticus TaxID=827 RepID=A0A9Q4KLQ6_9BACT|nr:hypothetical protein [Campylobacter ureolyticus]MCZ6159004.1 hypothetical protein [Campylobacter ureolyticus]